MEDLQELHNALSRDYVLEDDDPELNGMKISLSALFEGGLNFARLLPATEGDQFVSDQLTDPTLGGILPGATYANNESKRIERIFLRGRTCIRPADCS